MPEQIIYRSKFIISFIHVFFGYCLFVLIEDGFDINPDAFVFGTIITIILTFAITRYYKIIVSDEYLRGYTFWGKYYSIPWETITNVKPIRIIGMKYIKVFNTLSKRPLWVPVFLNNMLSFKHEAIGKMKEENPMRIYLENNIN